MNIFTIYTHCNTKKGESTGLLENALYQPNLEMNLAKLHMYIQTYLTGLRKFH